MATSNSQDEALKSNVAYSGVLAFPYEIHLEDKNVILILVCFDLFSP